MRAMMKNLSSMWVCFVVFGWAADVGAQTGDPCLPWDALINDSWIGPQAPTYMHPANSASSFEIQFKDAALTGPKAKQAKGMKAVRFRSENQTTGHLFTFKQTGDFEVVNFGRDWVYYDFMLVLAVETDELADDFTFSFSAHEPNQWDATLNADDFACYQHPEYDTQRPSGYYSVTEPNSEPLASFFDTDGYTADLDPNFPRHDITSGMTTAVLASNITLVPNGGSVRVYYQFQNLPAPVAFHCYFIQNGLLQHTNRTVIDINNPNDPLSTFEIAPLKPDFDGDGVVGLFDLESFCAHWLENSESPGWHRRFDLKEDGRIDLADYALFTGIWLAGYD